MEGDAWTAPGGDEDKVNFGKWEADPVFMTPPAAGAEPPPAVQGGQETSSQSEGHYPTESCCSTVNLSGTATKSCQECEKEAAETAQCTLIKIISADFF